MCMGASLSPRLCENKEQPKKAKEMCVCSKSSLNIFTPGMSLPRTDKSETADMLIKNVEGKRPFRAIKNIFTKASAK